MYTKYKKENKHITINKNIQKVHQKSIEDKKYQETLKYVQKVGFLMYKVEICVKVLK